MNYPLSREFARITSQSIGLLDSIRFVIDKEDSPKYPPYNIIQTGSNYKIEIAVAGFKKDELEVYMDNDILTVSGSTVPKDQSEGYVVLHTGISTRDFTRTFKLAEFVEVTNVAYLDGILTIDLKQETPDKEEVTRFDIK